MKTQKRISFIQGMLIGMSLMLLLMLVTRYFGIHLFSNGSAAEEVWERAKVVESYIDRYYWKDDTSNQTISEYAAKGMVAALGDKYSWYLTSQELKDSFEEIDGDYAGVGATMTIDANTGAKTIIKIAEGTPAQRAGLKVGDQLIRVNDQDVSKMGLNEAVALIKGKEGKKFILTIRRKENDKEITKKITVVCENIVTKSVSSKMLKGNIGYLCISGFSKETVKQFNDALADLDKKNQKGLIIDLRNNGGGSLTGCIGVLDRMLPAGKLIVEKNKVNGDRQYTSSDKQHFDKPVVVLINEGSASASEVFAGCMQDRKAATLLGTKSYGKGIVQTIFSLEKSCGGGIKLTTGEYLLPSNRCIQGEGLTPDIEIKYTGSSKEIGAADDNQLSKAVDVITEMLP